MQTKEPGRADQPRLHLVAPEDPRTPLPTKEVSLVLPDRPGAETARGVEYQFLKCLERNPLGELWLVRTPMGKNHLAQLLPPGENEAVLQRLEFLQGHQGLAPLHVARRANSQALLVMEYYPQTLRDRFQECWLKGLPGIPREELLSYVRGAAETLDALNLDYRVLHLALNPKNLVLRDNRLLVANFGLVELLWGPSGQPLTLLNPRYSAPELYRHHFNSRSDQYSLALIYAEMLTGVHPLRQEPSPPGRGQGEERTGPLDLRLLSSGDQEIIGRALSPRSPDRFATLTDLVAALEKAAPPKKDPARWSDPPQPLIAYSGSTKVGLAHASLDQFISELVILAGGPLLVREFNKIQYYLEPGRRLEHRFTVQNFPGAALLKLDGFRRHWQATLVEHQEDSLLISIHTNPHFWQRLVGRRVGLEIQVRMGSRQGSRRSEINVVIRPFGCGRKQALTLLEELGPRLLESIRSYLLAQPEQRSSERLLVSQPLRVCPVIGGVEVAEPIDCLSKDISPGGIGFFLPGALSASQVYVNLPQVPELASFAGLAQVVRRKSLGDGCYEIGAAFARPAAKSVKR